MKVTISKALKTKNRLTSRITQVKSQIRAHNAYIVDKTIPVDEIKIQIKVPELLQELDSLTNKLIAVKSAIGKGNVGSVDKIFRLSEAKGLLAYWEIVDCTEGRAGGYGHDNDVKRVQVSLTEKNKIVSELQKLTEKLQDELDEYNATTRVEIPDDVL